MFRGIYRVRKPIQFALSLIIIGIAAIGCVAGDPPTVLSLAATERPSPTFTHASAATRADVPTLTLTSTATPTDSPTPTDTETLSPTETELPTYTPTDTTTPTPADTPDSTVTPSAQAGVSAQVPILMYHHIAVPPPDADPIRVDLSVPPAVFDSEMKFLADQGFHSIHLTELVAHLNGQASLPAKPIVITFDDGYDDNYLNAFPTLKDFGLVGTFFIISDRPSLSIPGYMTWPQIEEMAGNGMEIGSHSLDHRFNLGEMTPGIQWAEIKPSYEAILQHFPNQPAVFAYPSGSYNATTLGLLKQLGYVAAVTTRQGVTQSAGYPLELKRVRIRGEWSISEFVYWLNYWLGGL